MRAGTIKKLFILFVIAITVSVITSLCNFVYNQNESNFQELKDVKKILERSTTKQSYKQPKRYYEQPKRSYEQPNDPMNNRNDTMNNRNDPMYNQNDPMNNRSQEIQNQKL